jgi:glycosyltransferase involved in cell wall biosynthesis
MSVYKSEKDIYLDRAIKSVWDDQTYKPSQIILVEDGPLTPELYDVIEKWQKRISEVLCLIINEENVGLTISLNKGLKMVTSDLIARMDTDDQSVPDRFAKQVEFLKEHSDIDVVGGAMEIVDKNGNSKYIKHTKLHHEEMVKQICWKCPLMHPTVMMRNSMFVDKGLSYNEEFRNAQDIALWVDAIMAGCKLANLPDVLLKFTEDEDVYRRRGKVRAFNEYKSFARAAKNIFGTYSPRRILPVLRYVFRRMPVGVIKAAYNSKWMKKIFKG